jgi:hypothetical protein
LSPRWSAGKQYSRAPDARTTGSLTDHMTRRLHVVPPNGGLQQIAAKRFSIPRNVIAILLQGFVLPVLFEPTRIQSNVPKVHSMRTYDD